MNVCISDYALLFCAGVLIKYDMVGVTVHYRMRKPFFGVTLLFSLILMVVLSCSSAFALTESEIKSFQKEISDTRLGERIAFWAEKFVGVPYDPDPLGEYVTKKTIVADERVDCMYLSFRALELAMGRTPGEAVLVALDKRFIKRGILDSGTVMNYDDRFQYGEDMIDSGKWGREITGDIGPLTYIVGTRGRERIGMVSKQTIRSLLSKKQDSQPALKSGDFVFFIKSPEKRIVEEIVGHIGIIKQEKDGLYLIHAGGKKKKGGTVKRVSFYAYVSSMPFVGVRVSRLD